PFRTSTMEDLDRATVHEALNHPTWSMGGKITIDSATLMNKGLEVIEAHWLFDVDYHRIDVVIHPQSLVHSFVSFQDGSVLAQFGVHDMRLPIQYALTYPDRPATPQYKLDLASLGQLEFSPPDTTRFPALALARQAGEQGKTFPTVLSAADEIAVEAFVSGRLRFGQIADVVSAVLDQHLPSSGPLSLDQVAEADSWARREARLAVGKLAS
ncbi:MAG TPA: 1-deoxy-D-xylulose-5-phosphate reductoisomerase, partial [Thermomicrobiaceae bacterium]|nr:1-deoxy-D-xylulose-5-phosphate reductoisomerase [Thermomicrobiaceae bacterium]